MNRIKNMIRSFANRGGVHIFSSTVFSKFAGLILSILVVRILTKDEYGYFSYAQSIIMILLPLSGLGLHHSLLRFASIEKDIAVKNNYFSKFVFIGFIGSLFLSILLFLFADIITVQLPGATEYLRILSPLMITFFLSELLFSYFRSNKDNKTYAYGMLLKSMLLLILCYVVTIKYGASGYAISYVIVPLIIAVVLYLIGAKKYKLKLNIKENIPVNEFLKYGLWVGLGSLISKLVFMMDTLMVGNILADSTQLAMYKVATIIPVNLIIIPAILIRTDFVYIAEKYLDKDFLINYYKKYLLIFSFILALIFVTWFLFSDQIVLLFGAKYSGIQPIIFILLIMLVGSFLFRIPLGNILSAVGKSKWNTISNSILVVENIILNLIFIPKFGISGAAIASAISIWTSGFINIGMFIHYLNKYCKVK